MTNGGRTAVDPWVVLPPPELVAVVRIAPTPEIPLASIRELLTACHAEDGALTDWTLFGSGLEHPDAVSEYLSWRRSWREDWPIGPISNAATLLTEVTDIDHHHGHRELDALLARLATPAHGPTTIAAADAAALLDELETVRLALTGDERSGWGIIDDMPALTRGSGLARAWASTNDEAVLAATTTTAVVVRPDTHLTVLHDGPSFRSFGDVSSADLRGDNVVLMDDLGRSLRLAQQDARPLGWLVPRSLRWHVIEVPLALVWTPLFTGLNGALRSALGGRHGADAGPVGGSESRGDVVVITGDIGVT